MAPILTIFGRKKKSDATYFLKKLRCNCGIVVVVVVVVVIVAVVVAIVAVVVGRFWVAS